MRAKLFDMIRACQMSMSIPFVYMYCIHIRSLVHVFCYAPAHAHTYAAIRNSHKGKLQNRRNGRRRQQKQKQTTTRHCHVFFAIHWAGQREREWERATARAGERAPKREPLISQATTTSTPPPHLHVSAALCSRVCLLFCSFVLDSAATAPTCVSQTQTQQHGGCPNCCCYLCCALVGLLRLFLLCSRRTLTATV